MDALILEPTLKIEVLITFGSQASFFLEINALVSLEKGQPLPQHFPQLWLNVGDPNVLLSFRTKPVFSADPRIRDEQLDKRDNRPSPRTAPTSAITRFGNSSGQLFHDRLYLAKTVAGSLASRTTRSRRIWNDRPVGIWMALPRMPSVSRSGCGAARCRRRIFTYSVSGLPPAACDSRSRALGIKNL